MAKGLHICRALLPEIDLAADAERLSALAALGDEWAEVLVGLGNEAVWVPSSTKTMVLARRYEMSIAQMEKLQKQMDLIERSDVVSRLMAKTHHVLPRLPAGRNLDLRDPATTSGHVLVRLPRA